MLFSHGLLYSRRMWDAQVAIDAPETVTAELRAFLAFVD